jgi:hypothetical protein
MRVYSSISLKSKHCKKSKDFSQRIKAFFIRWVFQSVGNFLVGIFFLALLASGCSVRYRVWYGHSPDRQRRVEVIERDGHQHLQIDNELPRRYLGVALETIRFSEDSKRLVYAAKIDSGWVIVVDSVCSRPWTGIGEVVFGPGQRLAYVANDSGQWRVVLEGTPSPLFEAVMQGSLTFSPDGRRLAFVVAAGDSFRVIVDGEPGPLYQAIGALRFNPEGKRLAYVAKRDGQQYLALGDELLGPFLSLADFTLGPGGRLGMLVRSDEEGWRAVVNGNEGEVFDNIDTIHFSPAGRYAYAAQRDSLWLVILEGERSPPYSSVGELIFARESLIYQARLEKDAFVVVDGIRGPSLKWVGNLAISADGTHFAYLGQPWEGNLSVFHHDTVYAVPAALDGSLVLSDDGQQWACLALNKTRKRVEVVIDGKSRRPFDFEELTALIMSAPGVPNIQHTKKLRRWVKAELDAFAKSQARPRPAETFKNP